MQRKGRIEDRHARRVRARREFRRGAETGESYLLNDSCCVAELARVCYFFNEIFTEFRSIYERISSPFSVALARLSPVRRPLPLTASITEPHVSFRRPEREVIENAI